MQQNQDIKGFTILELLAVLVIVVAVSAMGFPNFISWKTEREIRLATEKVSSMITNINTQVKRGNFLYVQLQIEPNSVNETNFTITIEAGSTTCWHKYIVKKGMNFGIDEFGKSAPYKEIYEYFGLTAENISKKTKNLIKS